MELHKKRATLEAFKAFIARVRGEVSNIDRGFAEEAYREASRWTQQGIADLENEKSLLDALVATSDASQMRFGALQFDRVLPLASCGAYAPEWDLEGRELQDIAATEPGGMAIASLNVLPNGSDGVAMIAWLGDRSACVSFARSLHEIPDERAAETILRLALQVVENTFISPKWWERLGANERDDLIRRARTSQEHTEFARGGPALHLEATVVQRIMDLGP